MKQQLIATACFFTLGWTAIPAVFCDPLLKGGTSESSHYEHATVIDAPLPEIPSELNEECFKSSCIARFLIKDDGNYSVKLLNSSGSEEVDDLALDTLHRWKFKPALLDGKPVESSRKIKIVFQVK